MKKATTKRERKYGKTEEKIIEEAEMLKEINVSVILMIDYGSVIRFENRKEAEAWIDKKHKESDQALRPRSSFTFI